jgi:hypothetical protein
LMDVIAMVHEIIDGTYRQTNLPNESPEYLGMPKAAKRRCYESTPELLCYFT